MTKNIILVVAFLLVSLPLLTLADTATDPLGIFDNVTADGVAAGWAYDPDAQSLSTDIDFYIDKSYENGGVKIGSASANLPRPDVNTHLGITGEHGFSFQIPAQYLDGKPHTIYAYVNNVPKITGRTVALISSPKKFTLKPSSPLGALDSISPNISATGWAYDPNLPTSPIRVDFYIDNSVQGGSKFFVGSTLANLPRPDVNDYLGITGNHGFSYSLPIKYVDGKPHTIYAYAINVEGTPGSNILLPNSPLAFNLTAAPTFGNSTISANGITITTEARYAGAISSLIWNGKEFIDNRDHGRLLQIAWTGDNYGECFNPTEGGSREDDTGPYTSSQLLLISTSTKTLTTVSHPAFWQAPNTTGVACGLDAKSQQVWRSGDTVNTTLATKAILSKMVTIGVPGIPNAMKVAVDIIPSFEELEQIPLNHFDVGIPSLFSLPEFSDGYLIDLPTGKLKYSGEFNKNFIWTPEPIIIATKDMQYAIGIYNPSVPLDGFPDSNKYPYNAYTIQNWGGNTGGMMIGSEVPLLINSGVVKHVDSYVVVGTLEDVTAGINKLYALFPPTSTNFGEQY